MSTKTYDQYYSDGTHKTFLRKKQGRTPSGLGKPKKYRLYEKDERRLDILKKRFGYLYNENEIIREAVRIYLDNSMGTELVNT